MDSKNTSPRRKVILKDAGIYAVSSYAAQALDIMTGVLTRNFLGPTNMGVWAFLQVIQNYAKHAGLGITTATARDVPYFLGKADSRKAEEIQNLVFSFTVVTAFLTAFGIAVFTLWNRSRYPAPIFYGLLIVSILIILQRVYNLFIVLLRSHKEFMFAGFINFASSFSGLFLTFLLTWKFRLYGFFAGLILNHLLMIGGILAKTSYRFKFYWNLQALRPLLSLGLAMLFSDILRTVLTNVDRIMIAKYLGFEALGHYSIALMAGNYLYSLPNMLGVIFFPHFQEVYAQRDNPRDLEKFLREPTLAVTYLFPFLIGFVWLISNSVVPWLLPQYTSGIGALKYFVLGSFFMALTHPYSAYIITVRKHWQLVPLQALSVAFAFGMTGWMLRLGTGIEGVAIASIIVALSHFLILSWLSLRDLYSFAKTLGLYARVGGVFAFMACGLWALDHLFAFWEEGGDKFLFQFLCFAVGMIPIVWLAEREIRIVSTLRTFLSELFLKKTPRTVESAS